MLTVSLPLENLEVIQFKKNIGSSAELQADLHSYVTDLSMVSRQQVTDICKSASQA